MEIDTAGCRAYDRNYIVGERYHIALDKYDKNIVINALNNLRNRQIQEERPTEPVDELIDKVANAPTRKVKVVPCRCNEER